MTLAQLIYNYRPSTGEYAGESSADESPLEPGVFLIPAHATTVAPPSVGANQAAVFDEAAQKWRLVPDFRGRQLYSTADGSAVSANLGQSLADLSATDKPRPSEAHVWKSGKWQADAAKQAEILARDIAAVVASVDAAVAAIYAKYTRFEVEYLEREKQALAYKAAGYTGEMPQQVAAFATPANKTGKQAADIILMHAAQLRDALAQLGVLRMRKYEVLAAPDAATAQAIADGILGAVAQIVAAL